MPGPSCDPFFVGEKLRFRSRLHIHRNSPATQRDRVLESHGLDERIAAGQIVIGDAERVHAQIRDIADRLGPRILDPDGSVQGSARGDPDMFTGFFGRSAALRRLLPWLPVSRRNVVDVNVPAGGPSRAVDWLSGACVLARRDALAAEAYSSSVTPV